MAYDFFSYMFVWSISKVEHDWTWCQKSGIFWLHKYHFVAQCKGVWVMELNSTVFQFIFPS